MSALGMTVLAVRSDCSKESVTGRKLRKVLSSCSVNEVRSRNGCHTDKAVIAIHLSGDTRSNSIDAADLEIGCIFNRGEAVRAFLLFLGNPERWCSAVFIEENAHRCKSP